MTTITCTKCYKSLDQFLFINKKGDFYKCCITCREQNNEYTSKTDENVSILSYNLENCVSGIEFSCFINISFLSNKIPKEIADNIKNFIGEVDGYYYM